MGKSNRERSPPRSRSPRRQDTHHTDKIPEMFKSKTRDPRGLELSSATNAGSGSPPSAYSGQSATASQSDDFGSSSAPVSLSDLRSVAADIKETLSAAIANLHMDMRELSAKVDAVERRTDRQDDSIRATVRELSSHKTQLREFQRSLEDIENRSRRQNIRLRGLPEMVDQAQLSVAVISIFNDLLGRPADSPIEIERLHRALRPRGRENDPPRDVIGCLASFRTKEEIMRQARLRSRLSYKGTEIRLFQDLAQSTLMKRKFLRPLTDMLKEKVIPFKWKFPFGLQAGSPGHLASLRYPEDVPAFCDILSLPHISIPDWHEEHQAPFYRGEEPMEIRYREPLESNRRRRHPPKPSSTPPANHKSPVMDDEPTSPVSRKARVD